MNHRPHLGEDSVNDKLVQLLDTAIDDPKMGELLRTKLGVYDNEHETFKDLLKMGLPTRCRSVTDEESVLVIIWKSMQDDKLAENMETFINLKQYGDDTFLLYNLWHERITQHLYTLDGTRRMPKYHIPPKHSFLCEVNYIGEITAKSKVIIGKDGKTIGISPDTISQLLLLNFQMPSYGIVKMASLSTRSRRFCMEYIISEISNMIYTSYVHSMVDKAELDKMRKGIESSEKMEIFDNVSKEIFGKLFNCSVDQLMASIESGNLPGHLNIIVSIMCMDEFNKSFSTGKYTKFDHMDTWERWLKSTLFTKAFSIYKWMERLKRMECMECGSHFDHFYEPKITKEENVLLKFTVPLSSISERSSIHVFSCCSNCCNNEDMTFVGDSFFSSVIPRAKILRRDKLTVNIYLLKVLRFIKASAVIIQKDIFKETEEINTDSLYTNEDSYLEDKRPIFDINTIENRQSPVYGESVSYDRQDSIFILEDTSDELDYSTPDQQLPPHHINPVARLSSATSPHRIDKLPRWSDNRQKRRSNIRIDRNSNKRQRSKRKPTEEERYKEANALLREISGRCDIDDDSGFPS